MSAKSRDAIRAVLLRHYEHVGVKIINSHDDLIDLVDLKPDLVFLGMKYIPNNIGSDATWISDFLDQHNINHTGSNSNAHRLDLNKQLAKQSVLDAGFTTSKFIVIKKDQLYSQAEIGLSYPLFVKPSNLGAGQGIDRYSVVANFGELQSKIDSLRTDLGTDILIEQYLSGREFSVAILKDKISDELRVMPIELIAPKNQNGERMLSKEVKQSDSEKALEITNQDVNDEVCDLAINAFKTLGGRDYGRIDIRMDDSGSPNFLEANLIPSLISGYGSFPKACLININLSYQEMLLSIVSLAFSRQTDSNNATVLVNDLHVLETSPV